jgi:mannose-6-phosphate isomerase-like protein (cupin superfamily)
MKRPISILVVAVTAACEAACDRPAREPRSAPIAEAPPEPPRLQSAELAAEQRKSVDAPSDTTRSAKKGFVQNIEKLTEDNRDFRRVLYTAAHSQLVVMALPPGANIGAEVHGVDQFFRVEEGSGEVVIGEGRTAIGPGSAIVVPAGTKHDIINTGTTPLQLYTIYSPPHHRAGVVHPTRADAEKDPQHFDGRTTE